MASVLAIVSKAVFEKEHGKKVTVGTLLPMTVYRSKGKALKVLEEGGTLYLVTVRPGEELWLVAVLREPKFDESRWTAATNAVPITVINHLIPKIQFESKKGISQEPGKLGMSLQTPRALSEEDVELLEKLVVDNNTASTPEVGTGKQPMAADKAETSKRLETRDNLKATKKAKTTDKTKAANPPATTELLKSVGLTDDIAAQLEWIASAIPSNPASALEVMIGLWQRTRWNRLAELVESLSANVESSEASDLRGSRTKVKQPIWMEFAKSASVLDRGAVAEASSRGSAREAKERVECMTSWDDPRVSGVAIRLLCQPIWFSTGANIVWTAIYRLLCATPDPRLLLLLDSVRYWPGSEAGLKKACASCSEVASGGQVARKYEEAMASIEASLSTSTVDLVALPFDNIPLPRAEAVEGYGYGLMVGAGITRGGSRTLIGLKKTDSMASTIEYFSRAKVTYDGAVILDGDGQTLWSAQSESLVLALSPAGERVTYVDVVATAKDTPGAFVGTNGRFEIAVCIDELNGSKATQRVVPSTSLNLSERVKTEVSAKYVTSPQSYFSEMSLSFVTESQIALYFQLDSPKQGFLVIYDLSKSKWQLIYEVTDPPNPLGLIGTQDGYLLLYSTTTQNLLFAYRDGRWKIRHALGEYMVPYRGNGRATIVRHPSTGLVVQRIGKNVQLPLDHLEAYTAHATHLGLMSEDERPVVSDEGTPFAYSVDSRGSLLVRAIQDDSVSHKLNTEQRFVNAVEGAICLADAQTVQLVDPSDGVAGQLWPLATPVVDKLVVSPAGDAWAVVGHNSMIIVEGGKKKSSKRASDIAMTDGGLYGVLKGRTLDVKRGGRKVVSLKADIARGLFIGLWGRPGFVIGCGNSVEIIAVDLKAKNAEFTDCFSLQDRVQAVAATSKGEHVAVGDEGTIHLFMSGNSKSSGDLDTGGLKVEQMAFHPDGMRVLALLQGQLSCFDFERGLSTPLKHPQGLLWVTLNAHAILPCFALLDVRGQLFLFHVDSSEFVFVGLHAFGTKTLAFVDDALFVGGALRHGDTQMVGSSLVRYSLGGPQ